MRVRDSGRVRSGVQGTALALAVIILGWLPPQAEADDTGAGVQGKAVGGSLVSEAQASAEAVSSGREVEATAVRDSYSQTWALADGTFRVDMFSEARWGRDGEGAWQPIDLSLDRRSDGSVGPRVAAAEISFSGSAPVAVDSALATVRVGEQQLALGWPRLTSGALDIAESVRAQVDGDTAVYPDVPLPGVNLRVTASADGFRQVLEIPQELDEASLKSLGQISFPVRARGARLTPGRGGGLTAVGADGQPVFAAPPAAMWDSTGDDRSSDVAEGGSGAATDNGDPVGGEGEPQAVVEPASDPLVGPDVDDQAVALPMRVDTEAGLVTIEPQRMLSENDVEYPVIIDPSIGWGRSEWTMIASRGFERWKFTGHEGVGLCPYSVSAECGGPGLKKRLLFEFGRSTLTGKKVLDATFRITEVYSASCKSSWVDLKLAASGISAGTSWPGPKSVDHLGDRLISAGRGPACDPEQPARDLEFHDNLSGSDAEPDENLTKTIASFANSSRQRITFIVKAKNEKSQNSWKRFKNNANLSVVYVAKPDKPKAVGVVPGARGAGVCSRNPLDPTVVSVVAPVVKATVQVQNPVKKDPVDKLRGVFQVQRYDVDTGKVVGAKWEAIDPASGGITRGTPTQATVTGLDWESGAVYRLRAATRAVWTFRSEPDSEQSGYTPGCFFIVDTEAPNPPTITAGTPYQECTGDRCDAAGEPGVPGTFQIAPGRDEASGVVDTDVTSYVWQLYGRVDEDSSAVNAGTGQVNAAPDGTAVITLSPPGDGLFRLRVQGRDGSKRAGAPSELLFLVASHPGPVAAWSFVSNQGEADASPELVPDTASGGEDNVLRLSAGARLDHRGRRGNLPAERGVDQSLALSDSDSYGYTDGPVTRAGTTFSVSAWAFLGSLESTGTVVSQTSDDEASTGWSLYYSSAYQAWVFNWHWKGADGQTQYARSVAEGVPVAAGVWTHLSGVYDAVANTVQIYVNGRPGPVAVADPAVTDGAVGGSLQVGRVSMTQGSFSAPFAGLVDEVKVWHRALSRWEVEQDSVATIPDEGPATALVASWDVNQVAPAELSAGRLTDVSGYLRPPLVLSATGARIAPVDELMPVLDSGLGEASDVEEVVEGQVESGQDTDIDDSETGVVDAEGGGAEPEVALVLDGSRGYARAEGPVVDETASFTVSTTVALDPAGLRDRPAGYRAQVIGQRLPGETGEPSWALWYQQEGVTDGIPRGAWCFGRYPADPGTSGASPSLACGEVFDVPAVGPDAVVAVTGVFDAVTGTVAVFRGTAIQDAGEVFALSPVGQGAGDLSLGRSWRNGAWGEYLPGLVWQVRVWSGAMSWAQVREMDAGTWDEESAA